MLIRNRARAIPAGFKCLSFHQDPDGEKELPGWGTERLPLLGGTKVPQRELGKEQRGWRQRKATAALSGLWEEEEEEAGVETLGLVV